MLPYRGTIIEFHIQINYEIPQGFQRRGVCTLLHVVSCNYSLNQNHAVPGYGIIERQTAILQYYKLKLEIKSTTK